MHYGETEQRAIYGEASLTEARSLLEEGIAVQPCRRCRTIGTEAQARANGRLQLDIEAVSIICYFIFYPILFRTNENNIHYNCIY